MAHQPLDTEEPPADAEVAVQPTGRRMPGETRPCPGCGKPAAGPLFCHFGCDLASGGTIERTQPTVETVTALVIDWLTKWGGSAKAATVERKLTAGQQPLFGQVIESLAASGVIRQSADSQRLTLRREQ